MLLSIKSSKKYKTINTNLILSGTSSVNISRSLSLGYLNSLDLICFLYKRKNWDQIIMFA